MINLYTVITVELVEANDIKDITFPNPNSNSTISTNNSIFIPASYIQERSETTGKLYALPQLL